MRRIAFALAVIVLATGVSMAEEKPGPNYKHLKFYDAYIGTWTWHGRLKEDMGFGKKGDVGTGSLTWKWGYNKNIVEWEWKFDFADQKSGTKGIITWDPSQDKIVGNGVSSDGVVIRTRGMSEDPMKVYVESVEPDGEVLSHVETFTLTGKDTMTIQGTEREGDFPNEDSRVYTFTRVKAGESEPGPNYEHLKFFDELVGTWVYDGPVKEDLSGIADKGTHVVNELSWEWILDKNALEWNPCATFSDGSKYAEEFLIGWDAQQGKIVYGGMDNTGGAALGTMTVDISDKSITYTGKGTDKDGEKTSHTCVIKITGKNTITWQALDRKGYFVNAESPVYKFKRVKKSN